MDDLITQAEPFEPTYHLNQLTSKIDVQEDHIEVTTNLDTVNKCKTLVIGGWSLEAIPRKLPVSNVGEFENKNIFYSFKKRTNFEGKKILIAGGGDSALDYVMGFYQIASDITLIHRRKEFKAVQDLC